MPTSEEFYRQYVISALWSESAYLNDDGIADENDDRSFQDHGYTIDNLAPDTAKKMREDCDRFCDDPALAEDLAAWHDSFGDDSQAAHDFLLDRNGHGVGFWSRFHGDNPLVVVGERLSEAAQTYGEYSLYLGADGLVRGDKG